MLENLLDRLPDVYNKTEQSGIYKIIKLAADQIAAGEATLQLIQDWRDIDQAQGKTLDKIGKDVGQPRGGSDDEQYRKAIKIKIRANLSGGEIETLNSIAIVLLSDRFDGIQEGWTLTNHPFGPTPAMMLFTVKVDGINFGLPMAEIDAISAGGVANNWELLIGNAVDISQTDYERWDAPYRLTNEMTTTTDQQQGAINASTIEAETQVFASMHSYLMLGASKAGEEVIL
jgi:uncharacterized protein YoaH (UPF0181 family)